MILLVLKVPPLKIQCATSMRSDVGWVCSLQFFFGLGTMFLNFLGYTVFVLTGRNVTKSCQEAQDSVTGRPAGYHVSSRSWSRAWRGTARDDMPSATFEAWQMQTSRSTSRLLPVASPSRCRRPCIACSFPPHRLCGGSTSKNPWARISCSLFNDPS